MGIKVENMLSKELAHVIHQQKKQFCGKEQARISGSVFSDCM
jgi:hypothetical protein